MIERLLFASRWLLLPFYLGLILALLLLVAKFLQKLAGVLPDFLDLDLETTIVASLKLVDITLTGNLVLMMILAGYENFISRIRTDTTDERPSWMGKIGFGALKMKL